MNIALSKVHCFVISTDFYAVEAATVFGFEISFDLYTLEEEALCCVETSESDYPLTHSLHPTRSEITLYLRYKTKLLNFIKPSVYLLCHEIYY